MSSTSYTEFSTQAPVKETRNPPRRGGGKYFLGSEILGTEIVGKANRENRSPAEDMVIIINKTRLAKG